MKENNYICSNRSKDYRYHIESVINETKKQILDFFEVEDDGRFNYTIYVYDTIEQLKQGLKIRGFDNMPQYMCACFKDEDQSLNFYEPIDEASENEWTKEEYDLVIFHELIHAIEHTIYGEQPEWLSEGIAKYFDGTYSRGIKWFLQNYINKQPIPEMRELEEEFGFHEYDSYDYAYIMVSYLIETMGKERFLEFLYDANKVTELSIGLTEKSIRYYEAYFS